MKNTHEPQEQAAAIQETGDSQAYVIPGVPIVRSNTPRSPSLDPLPSSSQQRSEHSVTAVFPTHAPPAPPVPEAYAETSAEEQTLPLPSGDQQNTDETVSEFLWLFEYGLEMDSAVLNSAERLNGLALPYGPAVLKGYILTFEAVNTLTGTVLATIVPQRTHETEVWGMLYRIPRRLTESADAQPSLLDTAHAAVPPYNLFERTEVTVHEVLRAREIRCITYIASATTRHMFHLLPGQKQHVDASYAQHLLSIARTQQFPDHYMHMLNTFTAPDELPGSPSQPVEQHTEPLPVLLSSKRSPSPEPLQEKAKKPLLPHNKGLLIFALYVVLTLIAVFVLAILQSAGITSVLHLAGLAVLGVPTRILVYGLLGGCLSTLLTVTRLRSVSPPHFVLVAWLARPYVGVVLAMLIYLLLHAGLVHMGGTVGEQQAATWLLATLAGFSERWLFYQRK